MVLPKALCCYSSCPHRSGSDLVQGAKTEIRGQGPDGPAPHSVAGVCAGHWPRPGHILQSRTVGPTLDLTSQCHWVADLFTG